jgi:hypothetical protein
VPELALDHDERNAFVRDFYGVCVPQLVRGEASTDTSCVGCPAQLRSSGGA